MPPAKAAERLRRLLVLIPYVLRHQGVELGELAAVFGAGERELRDDLNLLFVTGLPPYGPGDLIDVEVEDGRVWISMAEYFSRPVRLTRPEALSLYLRGKALLGAVGAGEAPALASALDTIEGGLGEGLGHLAGRVETAESSVPEVVETLHRAARDHERLEVEYYALSRDETSVRRIDPEEVFPAIGQWYVAAWDEQAGGERLFRADRMRTATPTGERFEPRGLEGAGRPLYRPGEDDIRVRLLLRPPVRWVAEYYETEIVRDDELGLEVILPASQLAWVAKLLVRLGPDAEILDPPELKGDVRRIAEEVLDRYR